MSHYTVTHQGQHSNIVETFSTMEGVRRYLLNQQAPCYLAEVTDIPIPTSWYGTSRPVSFDEPIEQAIHNDMVESLKTALEDRYRKQ